jgi:hypothetical protein
VGNIVGYEPVFSMRQQARTKGLPVLGYREFNKLPNKYFDACFASYVFHMSVEERSIYQLTQKMKEDAVLVANFYKNINVERMNQIFSKLDYRVIRIMDLQERFGSIYEYIRG